MSKYLIVLGVLTALLGACSGPDLKHLVNELSCHSFQLMISIQSGLAAIAFLRLWSERQRIQICVAGKQLQSHYTDARRQR